MTTTPFGPDALKAWSRDSFVGNECGSDEYRETQPVKGFLQIARAVELLGDDYDDVQLSDLFALTRTWLAARYGYGIGGYAGCDELTPALALVHDVMWEHGEHPYYGTLAELEEFKSDVGE